MDDYIIRDSSVWENSSAMAADYKTDCSLKIGVVRDVVEIQGPDIAYIVEVWVGGKYSPIQCTRGTRFGGIYNYEEFTYRGFEPDGSQASDGLFDYKKGDTVLVAYLYGDSREGIIINCINHPGRPKLFDIDDGIVYQSEFNGVNKSITEDGEYKVTFKGIQCNLKEIETPVTGEPIPAPEYDLEVGSSFYSFDVTGSYIVTDNATENPQSIIVDKPNGQIVITSGATSLVIDKAKESYTITNKETTFNSADKFSINTKETIIKSKNLIDFDAKDIKSKGKWAQTGNMEIKGGIKQTGNTDISGNLSTTGNTSLAGGANTLVYDIGVIKGRGNKGAPVFSTAVLKKTSLTKAS
jgi:hypothetical protein